MQKFSTSGLNHQDLLTLARVVRQSLYCNEQNPYDVLQKGIKVTKEVI